MSGEKATGPCNRFQANIFNKTKCQNCFKSRELHLLNDHDMEQAKPIYGGWLCLAPEGTDFDNPMQRSRKWQRRFFILYEHGSLSFALDELPSTLPQGTVNMNLCTDITDAEPRTSQRNALCIATPEQEIFIRGDNKEIINGWSEQLAAYIRTNKQNQKKKRKVEPVTALEPSPAKMVATDPSFPSFESSAVSSRWQEDQPGRGPDVTPVWTVTNPPGLKQSPADNLCPVSRDSLVLDGTGSFGSPISDLAANENADPGNNNQQSNNIQTSANKKNQCQDISHDSTTERILGLEAMKKEQGGRTAPSRKGRSEARANKREKLQSCEDIAQHSAPLPQRRAKSLDRRTSDAVVTPDLLNFKKGWMVKLDGNDQWKKYWFVLSTDSLRYYKDSVAEEASDLEGEIDLTKCYNVSEYQVQRNYGFQIHTLNGVYTLSAMTAGIRKNWIQALMKNVHPGNAPDVASLPEALPKPDVTQDSLSTEIPTERHPHPKPKSVMERRREGRYKTFDWAEYRPQNKQTLETDLQRTKPPFTLELGDSDRKKRREERRRRYESMLGFSLGWEETEHQTVDGSVRAWSPKSQETVEEEIEECWKQVEKTVFRLERAVPLCNQAKDTVEMEKLLDSYRKGVEDLKAKLAESERRRLEVEAHLSTAGCHQQQLYPTLQPSICSEADFCLWNTNEKPANSRRQSLKDVYEETRELLGQQNIISQDIQEQLGLYSSSLETPSIQLQDTEGSFSEQGDFLSDRIATPLLSPASDNQHSLLQSENQTKELNFGIATAIQQREDGLLFPTSETQINNSVHGSSSVILENPTKGDGTALNCFVEQHIPPDQAVVRKLSQEVELLTSQNEALNQRNQEMLNQLTEADREIERLKAELSSRYPEPHHLPEVEQQGKTREDLERELSLRKQELLEAQMVITSLGENLRETEALLQLNIPTETEESGEERHECAKKADEYLLQCFEATETRLTELERQLDQSELTCSELQEQNSELTEAEKLSLVQSDAMSLNQEVNGERLKDRCGYKCVSGEERIQQVIQRIVMRLEALGRLLEVISRLDCDKESEHEEEKKPMVVNQLKWEESFWSSLLNGLNASPSHSNEEKGFELLLSEVTEDMMLEKQVLLLGHSLLSQIDKQGKGEVLKDLDIIWNTAHVTATETKNTDESGIFEFSNQMCDIEHFRAITQMKISLLNNISSVSTSAPEKFQFIANTLNDFHNSDHPWSGFLHSAATEALYCCHLSRLLSKYERQCEETKEKLLASSLNCSCCVTLMKENGELKARLEEASSWVDKVNICCQTDETYPQDTDTEVQMATESTVEGIREENVPDQPVEISGVESHLEMQEISDDNTEKSDEAYKETVPSEEMNEVSVLRRRVKELEELLSVAADEVKKEFDGKMSSMQMQHEKEIEKLKATCERAFASIQESHLKVVEELQHRHQQEVERLIVERDLLLEEESAATATAIEAIKNAHRLELERELQKRCQSENSSGNTYLEDTYRQHREELASCQRELEVLSQQFSLKCLENVHLVQALDAERKALCQCQQENQDLRTRNQELNGHLAAEITRLCSLAKHDNLPPSQGMDVYEMEITLRVKESEVQCLKQEITSLKEELQSAQRDKRNATKKYKDMYTELSIVRVKTEREMDELRENLRLAHQALGHTSP
ncbi:myosin phosphatase Rho-interacting protein-like isoform X2 [Mastacembelus armatus]|uniref:myosin phosphatase Rho-interacting protein-like isoform X2 n=1 Tax=Mastacembelus armatus TaxID=205130 RepID=UPI000E45BDAC|nr:myosin phosphatase Rho-interacting protein-like isoform X2 [Mastacembelus armatus]